jgi:cytochrome oxidase Cu insertion factor (SCO1/SenC/PrrC family)
MKPKTILILVTLMVFVASMAAAHEGSSHPELGNLLANTPVTAQPDGSEQKARRYFTDLPVVTQDGKKLRFFTDVLKDHVVLVSLFYTNCTGMCPLTNQKLAEVQDLLGDDFGRKIRFVSLTLEPETDTPEVLKDYAMKFEAKDGWLFLTGDKKHLEKITNRLGQANREKETHNPYVMIGNVGIARWSKIPPNVPGEIIAARLRQMASYTAAN